MALSDITYTVKASEANGRRLLKDTETGETVWEPAAEPVQSVTVEAVVPAPSPTKRKRRQSEEGDK